MSQIVTEEVWKSIPSFWQYEISNHGRVRRIAHISVTRKGAKKYLPEHYLKVQRLGNRPYVNLSLRKGNESHKQCVRIDDLIQNVFGSDCNIANDIK
jgi:hypothetical protein